MNRLWRITFTLAAGLALAPPMQAQTTRWVAPSGSDAGNDCIAIPCATITHAISVSSNSEIDTIRVRPGDYTESFEIDKSIILRGSGEADTILQAHTLPGMASSRVITIDGELEVAISSLTIRHGRTGGFPNINGGGLFVNGASVSLENVDFEKNEATLSGGGMYIFSGTASLTGVTFSENSAVSGGGMYIRETSPTLTQVTFNENSANFGGGAYSDLGAPELKDVTFHENSADESGGGMFNYDSFPMLFNVTFRGNIASGMESDEGGGGMYSAGAEASPTLENVGFVNNTAERGGGLRIFNSDATLNNVTFIGNTADIGGGGMHVVVSDPILTDVTFLWNTAIFGGGMYNRQGSALMTNVAFDDNRAQLGGGMLNLFDSPTLTNTTFIGNVAEIWGGGMDNWEGSPVLTDVTFSGNTAERGGGMRIFNSDAIFNNVTFIENTADISGGGMHVEVSDPILTNVSFIGNMAFMLGGGMLNIDNSNPVLTNVSFSGNRAVAYGGGMYNSDSTPTLTNVIFSGNRANDEGGGLYNRANSNPTLTNSIFWNNGAGSSTGSTSASIWNSTTSSPNISWSLVANCSPFGVWRAECGTNGGNNLPNADPLFVSTPNPANAPTVSGNLRLQPGSPAIDTGDPATDPGLFPGGPGAPVDLDGNPRFLGAAIDMGAFEWQPVYSLVVNVNGSGTVNVDPEAELYDQGDEVTLTAAPDPDWIFTGWSGDVSGNDNPLVLVIEGDTEVTASFEAEEPPPDENEIFIDRFEQ